MQDNKETYQLKLTRSVLERCYCPDFSGLGLSKVSNGWLSVESSSLTSRAICIRKWWNMVVETSKVWMTPFVSVICIRIEGLNNRFKLDVMMVTSIRHLIWNKPRNRTKVSKLNGRFPYLVQSISCVSIHVPGCRIRFLRLAFSSYFVRLKPSTTRSSIRCLLVLLGFYSIVISKGANNV